MKKLVLLVLPVLLVLAMPGLATARHQPPSPSGLVSVPGVGRFWPYTDRNYSRVATDPISLAFRGKDTDPRLIRQILMGSTNPVLGCTWKDAIGRPQTTYSRNARWQGSAIQLECGDYSKLRLHLRLFRHGPSYTLGGAHLEVQIPGTTEHVVLSWIHAREMVLADLDRSGHFFHDPVAVPGITAAPSWRTIDKDIYNLLIPQLPLPLRQLLELPLKVDSDFDIPNDSVVRVVTLWGQFDPIDSDVVVEFDHMWGQFIPKPFCASGEIIRVDGPIHMVHRVKTDVDGRYYSSFHASGTLWVIDPPGQHPATVSEVFRSYMSDRAQSAFMKSKQVLYSDPIQWVFEALWAGRRNVYLGKESCGY